MKSTYVWCGHWIIKQGMYSKYIEEILKQLEFSLMLWEECSSSKEWLIYSLISSWSRPETPDSNPNIVCELNKIHKCYDLKLVVISIAWLTTGHVVYWKGAKNFHYA